MVIERLLIVVALVGLMALGWLAWRWLAERRLQRVADAPLPADLGEAIPMGRPTVIYFTTDYCGQCRLQQTPILEQVRSELGVVVHTVDAALRSDVADFYGVMTVPTTIVLDAQRRPVAANHGLASLAKLRVQLAALAA